MTTRRVSLAVAALFLVLTFRPLAQEQAVPGDLKPLLAAPQSEMRMVVQRYTLDRQTLSGNYANGAARGGRGGRGRGGDAAAMPAPPPLVPMSPARIARLKRFDTNWQAALARVDAAKLTGAAKTDFETLKSAVGANLAQLDVETLTMRQALAVAPFAPRLVQLVEARIRVEDMDSQRAAGVLTDVAKEVAKLSAEAPRVNREQATLGANAVDQLRGITTEWFNFYNGYDPLFTWWMGEMRVRNSRSCSRLPYSPSR